MSDGSEPFSLNVRGVTNLVESSINKTDGNIGEGIEGASGEKFDALRFDMEDDDLLKLKDKYESKYTNYESKHKLIVEKNMESYLGKTKNGQWLAGTDPIAANIQFEAEETFLAATLAKNPEPVVFSDNTPEGNAIANSVKTMLAYHADQLVVRRKLSLMVRQWSIHHLGVIKVGWNRAINDVAVENRKIQNFVFDPDGYVDAYGDFIGYLGERFEVTADVLMELFPKHKDYIELTADGQLGTKCVYTEWVSADNSFFFTTYREKVLDKFKNPYFKYQEPQNDPLGNPVLDDNGDKMMTEARNHFAVPKKPYIFLSVYSLQEQPHDITGLIEQNIANQNLITRRTKQIDFNASTANNSYAFSEDNFTEETAKQAATAREKGNPILIPSGGPIDKAILPLNAQGIPAQIFEQLETSKNDLRTSWGVQGITAEPEDNRQTARGMILNQSHDTTRIGGGIGEAIEQVADNLFNWLTQLYYIYYDEKHWAAVMGNAKAVEYVTLSAQDLDRQLIVSVAPDSLRPKDDITNMNLAQELFDKGAIGPKTLLKMLDFPDPDNAAADGVLYRLDPATYFRLNFPEEFARMQEAQNQQAQVDMAHQAQSTAMNASAQAAGEGQAGAKGNLSQGPASANLSQVPLPA